MRFRLWHLIILVTVAGILAWAFTQIGTNSARYEILELDLQHDQQWNKRWSRIKWKIHLPAHQSGETFTSFIEVDQDFDSAGFQVGDVLRFRFQETRLLNRPAQNPKKLMVKKLFAVEGNVLEDNGGDIFAGPFPTVKKEDADVDWE